MLDCICIVILSFIFLKCWVVDPYKHFLMQWFNSTFSQSRSWTMAWKKCTLHKQYYGVYQNYCIYIWYMFFCNQKGQESRFVSYSNMTSFFRFVDKHAPVNVTWLFHWQHKLCVTFSANININYHLPIKVYYRICILRHIRIKINHGSQNMFWALTWIGGY